MSSSQQPKGPAPGKTKSTPCGVFVGEGDDYSIIGGSKVGFPPTAGVSAQLYYGWPQTRSPHITLLFSFDREPDPAVTFFSGTGAPNPPINIGIRFRPGTFTSGAVDITDFPAIASFLEQGEKHKRAEKPRFIGVVIKATQPPAIEGIGLPFVFPTSTKPSVATAFLNLTARCAGVNSLSLCQQTEFKVVIAFEGMLAIANDQFSSLLPSPDKLPGFPRSRNLAIFFMRLLWLCWSVPRWYARRHIRQQIVSTAHGTAP